MKYTLISICCLLMISCSGKINHNATAPRKFPDQWQQGQSNKNTIKNQTKWWLLFNSPELNDLITIALNYNQDLIAGVSRVKESYYMSKNYHTQKMPTINATGNIYRNINHPEASHQTLGNTTYNTGLIASWEIDLWGRVKNNALASDYDYQQVKYDVIGLQHSIVAEVVNTWLQLVTARQEHILLKQQLQTEITALELIEARFKQNITSSLDVLKQRQSLTSVKRQIPPVLQNIKITENRLRTLLGTYPKDILDSSNTTLPDLPSQPKLLLPSTVIVNRPDIKKAWFKVLATDARLAVAKANRLPALSLSATGNFLSTESNKIFNNWTSNLAASLLAPIFDGGRLSNLQKAQAERLKQSINIYTKTVYTALSEIENAMIAEKYQSEYADLIKLEIKQSRSFLKQATQQYINGLIDYLEVVRNRATLNNLERAYLIIKHQQLEARVSLHRSIASATLIEGMQNAK